MSLEFLLYRVRPHKLRDKMRGGTGGVVPFSVRIRYPSNAIPQMVDQQQLGTYTASDNILPFSTKLVTRYYFWSGPKTSTFVAPQVTDSTYPIFGTFRIPKITCLWAITTNVNQRGALRNFPQPRSVGSRKSGKFLASFRVRDIKSDGMRRPVSAGCDTLPMFDVLKAQ